MYYCSEIVYLTFPAALPLMGFVEMFRNYFFIEVFIRFITHKKDNKYQIERIYLTESGDIVEIWLANKIRRKLKDTNDEFILQVKDLKPPPVADN